MVIERKEVTESADSTDDEEQQASEETDEEAEQALEASFASALQDDEHPAVPLAATVIVLFHFIFTTVGNKCAFSTRHCV